MRLGGRFEPNRSFPLLALALVLLLGLVLRLYGIEWGLPSPLHPQYSYHPDEVPSLIWAEWLPQGKITSKHFIYGGTLYFTILDSILFFGDLLGGAMGKASEVGNTILLGRYFMALFALLTILLVHETGRALFDKRVGLCAALLLSINPAHIFSAQQVRVDAIAALCAVLVLFLAGKVPASTNRSRLKYLVLSGLAVGAATALRFPLALCLSMPVAGLLVARATTRLPGSVRPRMFTESLLLAGAALGAYFIASPHTAIYLTEFINGLAVQWSFQAGVFVDAFDNGPGLYQYGWRVMYQALGYPGYALAVAGLVLSISQRAQSDWLILPFVILYFALLNFASWVVVRYLVPLLPFIMLLSARWVFHIVDRYPRQKAAVYCGMSLVVLWTLTADFAYLRITRGEDIRDLASRWIADNVESAAAVITLSTYDGDVFLNPPIPERFGHVNVVLDKEKGSFDMQSLEAKYLVVNEGIFRDLDRLGPRHPLRGYWEFYEALQQSDFRLVKEFKKPVEIWGIDFSSWFRSYDYLIVNPGIRIFKRMSGS